MTEPVWYRSLYGRMAIGALAGLTGLLLAQAALFLWLAGRSDRPLGTRSPQRALRFVALDLTTALEADPAINLDAYMRDQFGRLPWRIFAVRPDGRVAQNRDFVIPDGLLRAARIVAHDEASSGPPRAIERVGPRLMRVRVDGHVAAIVGIAPGEGPWTPVFREYGPPLVIAGAVLLVTGAGFMALFVLRPARRRLRTLQHAAEALGGGDSATRAPESGGDEVAALARSFNHMAAELESRVQELKASDRLRRQLLADVSHELMTPLTAIRGYLETLSLPGAVADAATRDRYLRVVTEETLRLESIVGDLLDLARLEGGGSVLHREPVPVDWLFSRVAERHEVGLRDRGIRLERRIEPGAERVDGDARRLEQVLQNLAANAVRHTPPGGRITLSAEAIDGHVVIRVADTGTGIAPEHVAFVFDRFYKADAARAQGDGMGSGLGLSIVRAIVERHGGQVAVSSAPGGGTVFEITLDAASDVVA
jgi:two-component system OmpR family sensor kinase